MTTKTKLTIAEIGKAKKNPIFKGLPARLKNSTCYVDIERQLEKAVYSDHVHPNLKSYARCKPCAKKRETQAELKRTIGFASQEQYLEWKKIMSIIIAQADIQLT